MIETELFDISEQMLSEKPRIKMDSLRNLRSILGRCKDPQFIGEKCYQRLLETLIKAIMYEKYDSFQKGKLSSTSVFSRFQEYGIVLRSIIELGNKFLKSRTSSFVLNHIVDILSVTEGILYQAVSVDYIKCLKSILSYPPHVEHLSICEWEKLVIFCCSFINNFDNDFAFFHVDSSSNSIRSQTKRRLLGYKYRLRYESVELMHCLQILVSWFAAPLGDSLFKLIEFLLNFLFSYTSETNAHLSAFISLNSAMQKISTNNFELSSLVARDMVKLCIELWNTKSSLLKSQLIIGLTLSCPYWYGEFNKPYQNILEMDLVSLFCCIQFDYIQDDKGLLSVDDIVLHFPVSKKNDGFFACFSSSLRCIDLCQTTKKAEQSFFIIQIVACIVQIFESKEFSSHEYVHRSNVDEFSEIYKAFSFFRKIGNDAYKQSGSVRIFWLQIMVFFFERVGKCFHNDFSDILCYFISLFSDDDVVVQAWALLGVGSFLCWKKLYYQINSSILDLLISDDILQLCLRKLTIPVTCRSACHLLSLLIEFNIIDIGRMVSNFRNIFDSIEINGPAIISNDSCRFLLLLRSVLKKNNCVVGVNESLILICWFFSRWNSLDFLKKSNISCFSSFPVYVVEFLISCCFDSVFFTEIKQNNQFGIIGLSCLKQRSSNDVLSYFLLHELNISQLDFDYGLEVNENNDIFFDTKFIVLERVKFIVLSIQNTAKNVINKWVGLLKESIHVNVDIFRSFVQFSFVVILFARFTLSIHENMQEFIEISISLIKELVKFLTSENCSREEIRIMFCCLSRIPCLKFGISSTNDVITDFNILFLDLFRKEIYMLLQTLKHRNNFIQLQDSSSLVMDDDDRVMVCQKNVEKGIPLLREYIDAKYSIESVETNALLYLELVLLSNDPLNIFNMSEFYLEKSNLFILFKSQFGDNLVQLGFFLVDYLSYSIDKMMENDVSEILENFAKTYLTRYELERSDVVMVISIDFLIVIVRKWLITKRSLSLRNIFGKIFEWILKIALKNYLASFFVRIKVLELLSAIFKASEGNSLCLELLNITPDHIFLQLLKDNDSRVLYLTSMMVGFIFRRHEPVEHSKVYFNIVDRLEINEEKFEKIALRAFTLSNIITVSEYVRKVAFYNLIELGKSDLISSFVSKCLQLSYKSLSLDSVLSLFNIYRSQIIWSWLNFEEKLDKFPFKVLNFSSIIDFYSSNFDEIMPQLILLGKNEYVVEISNLIHVSLKEKIRDVFHRIIGYTLLSYNEKKLDSAQIFNSFCKSYMEDSEFGTLLKSKFPMIVSVLFESMRDETFISKTLRKFDLYREAINYEEICNFGISNEFLPESFRPFYKVKTVIKSIQDLCEYTDMSMHILNDSYIIAYIFRRLLLYCQLGLSSSEKCLYLRKFRVYISLLDKSMIRGRILQILLDELRKYLCFSECFVDVSGILQYLLMSSYYCHDFFTLQSTVFLNVVMNLIRFGISNIKVSSNSLLVDKLFLWIIEYCDLIGEIQDLSSISFLLKFYCNIVVFLDGFISLRSTNSEILLELLLKSVKFLDKNSALFLLEVLQDDPIVLLLESDKFIDIKKVLFSLCNTSKMSSQFFQYNARILGQWCVRNKIVNMATYIERSMNSRELSMFKIRTFVDPRSNILSTVFSLLTEGDYNIVIVERILRNVFKNMSLEVFDKLVDYKYKDIASIYMSNLFVSERNQLLEYPFLKFDEYYWKDKTISFSDFLRFFLRIILHNFSNDSVLGYMNDLVEYIENFSEKIFIFSVDYLLLNKSIGEGMSIIENLNKIVDFVFSQYEDSFYRPHIFLMIEMILYLRSQTSEIHYSGFDLNFRLDVNYFSAALAAASCQLWETSLLFICIYWTLNDSIVNDEMLKLLSVVYKKIDDPDSFYGIPYTVSLENILSRYKFEGNGWKSLFLHGAALENDLRMLPLADESEHMLGIMEAFNSLGFRSFSRMNFSNYKNNIVFDFVKDQYASSWRLEQWDLPCAHFSSNFDHIVYNILQVVNKGSLENISHILNNGYSTMINIKKYPFMSDKEITGLIMLTEIEEFFSLPFSDVWLRWQSRLFTTNFGIKFDSIEPVLSLRQVLLSSVLKNTSIMKHYVDKSLIQKCLIKILVELCQVARISGNLQIAFSAITYAERLLKFDLKGNSAFFSPVAIQISRVLWDQGDRINSVKLLCEIVNGKNINISEKYEISPEASWTSELRLERPDFIMEKYFKSAVKLLNNSKLGNDAGYVFHTFGFFCDKQLESLSVCEDFEKIQKLRKQNSEELAVLDQMINKSSKYDREVLLLHRAKAKALFDIDDVEFNRLIENKEVYLRKSIKNYLKSLVSCDNYDYNIFRCMSLWLSNIENDNVNKIVYRLIYNIATRKFLILFNQLASRLSENTTLFQSILHKLVKRICVDHPYHSLFYLISLKYLANKDDKLGLLRKKTVDEVLCELLLSKELGDMLKRFMSLCSAYIDFAVYKVEKKEFGINKIAFSLYPKSSVFLNDIPKYKLPPPTMDISVRNDCNYDDVPIISYYVPYFMLASGISSPKVIECVGSDGHFYKQLVKGGNDDLRQDVIMEQVFQQAHTFLQKNRLARQRNLGIRTYKILPLTMNTGILEWVLHTLPIQDYLHPAHEKYHPKDWSPAQCRKAIDRVSRKSKEVRFQTYEEVTSHFRPVMRHFFMDHYSDPKDWFQKQLNYTRSTAAISILGYVLGLGDRHGHNILIDKTNGEIVHIDLGVAFDQGKLLPIPETVPFRLTRDIVDGMGIIRTEGVFRRCCEFTLNVLREEAYNIINILETLKYDSLYSWYLNYCVYEKGIHALNRTISPLRIKKMQENQAFTDNIGQGSDNEKENIDGNEAERALLVVSRKLSKTLSVEAVVNELIHEATNPNNLALLFCGWGAYF
ncbi:hypothetical protein PORY_001579 [Pneumocystis oryctolagi]|uniref:Uncharacterized protein n=1 Tax=Pneumocystis oryctolagi TaxID=42067 RepID=A0ACB7CDG0_9ASCO|nr:hypothetical protein PORY_001579 [Pneumocystis oryctolagi]